MSDLLTPYRQLDQLHTQMLESARHLEWDALFELHTQSQQLLKTIEAQAEPLLDTPTRAEKATLIRRVLDMQTQITAEIRDWQQDVAPMLANWKSGPPA